MNPLVPAISLSVVATLSLAACASATSLEDKVGPRPRTITLNVGDRSGTPADQIAHLYAAEVEHRSGGALTIVIKGTDEVALPADFATTTITSASKDEPTMLAVPARAWSGAGVQTLQPLEVPLLITSDATLDKVSSGPTADAMLAGLRPAGWEPLALVPLGLRVVESYGEPLDRPDKFDGAKIRTWTEGATADALRALSSKPTWIGGFDFQEAAKTGALSGALAVLDPSGPNVVAQGIFTVNLPFYADATTLALSERAWNQLDDPARAVLSEAAARVRDQWVSRRLTQPQAASQACDLGFGIAQAASSTITQFQGRFQPIVEAVAGHASNADTIQRIRDIEATTSPSAVDTCLARTPDGDATASGDQRAIDGSWRRMITQEEWEARGLAASDWPTNGGLHTQTFESGTWRDHDVVAGNPPDGTGTFTIDGDRLTVTLDDGTVLYTSRFVRDGDRLTLSGSSGDQLAGMWDGQWAKVG